MRRFLLALLILTGPALLRAADAPIEAALVVGTFQPGQNASDPQPQKSEYLETTQGGVLIAGDNAGLYLFTKVIKRPLQHFHVVVEFQNPSGGAPIRNEVLFKNTATELHFSTPGYLKDLKNYGEYEVTVRIYISKESKKPVDTLKQTIRSYVDTHGAKAKLFSKLKEQK